MLYFILSFGMLLLACFLFLVFFTTKKYGKLLFCVEAFLSMAAYVLLLKMVLMKVQERPGEGFRVVRPILAYIIVFLIIKSCSGLKNSISLYLSGWIYLLREFCYDFGEVAGSYLKLWENGEVHTFTMTHIFIYISVYILALGLIIYQKNRTVNWEITKKQIDWSLFLTITAIFLKIFSLSSIFDTQQRQDGFFILIQGWLLFSLLILYQQYTTEQELHLRVELSTQEQLWKQREIQMKKEKENQEVLNQKYHDLKHYISYLRNEKDNSVSQQVLDELERAVKKTDISIHTGNEILNTILVEKSLECEHKDINMTCVADGKLLSGMESVDLYVMFSNILDNAIRYLESLEDIKKRTLSVAVFRTGKFVKIQVENYCENKPVETDGMLITTKKDKINHGIGLKSIRSIAEKYNGSLSVQWKNKIFVLNILFIEVPQIR